MRVVKKPHGPCVNWWLDVMVSFERKNSLLYLIFSGYFFLGALNPPPLDQKAL